MSSHLAQRFLALRDALLAHEALWRPAPFHALRPDWCTTLPGLAEYLLDLPQEVVERTANDSQALIDLLARWVPEVAALQGLIAFPTAGTTLPASSEARLLGHVPGRKQAQILAFAAQMGAVGHPLLEWCSGKGHLGRLLARRHGRPVTSLEIRPELVAAGMHLAQHSGLDQVFVCEDALSPAAAAHAHGRHALALHACGDLHLNLLRAVVAARAPALDLAPCCYYRTARDRYAPLCDDVGLALTRDELHLAVTETVTSGQRDRRISDLARARKLAFLEWRALQGVARQISFKSVPAEWLERGFVDWMGVLCQREGLPSPSAEACVALEQAGWRRHGEVQRLELVRLAFRRPLEVWLVLDQAVYLERNGYRVRVTEFCSRQETPRNLLISAQL